MQSWGIFPGLSWNGPAWSLSSEWLAYVLLPLLILTTAGLRRVRDPLVAMALVFSLFLLVFFGGMFSTSLHYPIDVATGAGASARVLIGVTFGCILRRLYDQTSVRALPWTALFWLSIPVALACQTDLTGHRLGNSPQAYVSIRGAPLRRRLRIAAPTLAVHLTRSGLPRRDLLRDLHLPLSAVAHARLALPRAPLRALPSMHR